MAVRGPFSMNHRYIGLSSDVKPTNVDIGSVLFETDTLIRYIWTGTDWVELL